MAGVVCFLIRIYQRTLSPVLAVICGPGSGCRFEPTCSEYFFQAVKARGVTRGSWLGLKRLARCQPWGDCGYDPVPGHTDPAPSSPAVAGIRHPASGRSA